MSTRNYNGHTKEIHEIATKYIENEIWAVQTSLVTEVLNVHEDIAGIRLENIQNLYIGSNEDTENTETQEIYEWYLISEWLAKKLDAHGEPILYGKHNYYWGRTCTGQAIILDGLFQAIAQPNL